MNNESEILRVYLDAKSINLVNGKTIFGIGIKKLGIQSFINKVLERFAYGKLTKKLTWKNKQNANEICKKMCSVKGNQIMPQISITKSIST